jgi:glycosyltransferase involved in cell wall biosynthesis
VEADAEYYRRFMLAMGNLEDTSLFEGKICLDIGCGPKGRLRRSANLPMTNPTVSVVMSVFNGEPYLHEALESILNQTFRDFEFIIINDGSTDGSATVLESYRKSDSRLRVYHQENRGVGESLNRGCGLAQGKYIARMDADDIATSGRLMRQVEFMEGHPEVDVVGGAVEFIDATGKSLAITRYPETDHEIKTSFSRQNPLVHPTVLFRRDVFLALGGYRAVFKAEDYDLWLRIAERGQLANLGEVVLKYRIHPDQVTRRSVRGLVISVLASQALASSSGNGYQDRLGSVKEITPAVLAAWGVTDAEFQRALAAFYLQEISLMCWVGQEAAALALALEMLRSSRWEHMEKRSRIISDTWLRAAGLYWGQDQYFQSVAAAARALTVRPIIAGRPLKRILNRLTESLGRAKRFNATGKN